MKNIEIAARNIYDKLRLKNLTLAKNTFKLNERLKLFDVSTENLRSSFERVSSVIIPMNSLVKDKSQLLKREIFIALTCIHPFHSSV